MSKVYCKNCKWTWYHSNSMTKWDWCDAPVGKDFYGQNEEKRRWNPYTVYSRDNYVPSRNNHYQDEFNKTGECPYYKRLWWKFWV